MNINELTIGQVQEIVKMFAGPAVAASENLMAKYIGKYVIVRSRNEGINAGVVVDVDDTGIVLKDARRLWYHAPADESLSWYEGVAESGLAADSKVSPPVLKAIIEDYSVTLCTEKAQASIRGAKSHAQN